MKINRNICVDYVDQQYDLFIVEGSFRFCQRSGKNENDAHIHTLILLCSIWIAFLPPIVHDNNNNNGGILVRLVPRYVSNYQH